MIELEMALQSIKAVKTLAAGAFNAKVDQEVQKSQIEIQSKLLELQEHLLNAVQERLELVTQLDEVKRKVRDLEESKARLDGYELTAVGGEAYLYKSKDSAVEHYACPVCYEKGARSVLQCRKTASRQMHYLCGTCKFSRYVGPSDPISF